VANAVLDGVDGILLGQETLRGGYPIESVQTVVSICKQVRTQCTRNAMGPAQRAVGGWVAQ